MNCPKCKHDQFKAAVARKHRLKRAPAFLPVRLTCAKCGHNLKAYVIHEDLKMIHGLIKANEKLLQELIEKKEKQPKEKKGLFGRLFS